MNPPENPTDPLSLKAAARLAGVSPGTVRRRREALEKHGATATEEGWSIPIEALIAAGLYEPPEPGSYPQGDTGDEPGSNRGSDTPEGAVPGQAPLWANDPHAEAREQATPTTMGEAAPRARGAREAELERENALLHQRMEAEREAHDAEKRHAQENVERLERYAQENLERAKEAERRLDTALERLREATEAQGVVALLAKDRDAQLEEARRALAQGPSQEADTPSPSPQEPSQPRARARKGFWSRFSL